MIEPVLNKYTNIIFLDHDGVLNCQLFYTEKFSHLERFDGIPLYKVVKKYLHKIIKKKEISDLDYYKSQTCEKRIGMLNELCKETNSAIVFSASMRSGWSVEDLQRIFNNCGATFTIIDKTGYCDCRIRGVEIHKWLQDNCKKWFGVEYYDFYRYAIIDDDGDMLLEQQQNFFQTDNYNGLTPTTCYKIKRFFTHKTF
jgi:histidinol phosphatase-like enzyme